MAHHPASKTLTFHSTINRQFYLTLKQRVYAYFEEQGINPKANLQTYLKAMFLVLAYFLIFGSLICIPLPGYSYLLLLTLLGIVTASIGLNVMHDGAHHAIAHKNWINQLFAGTIYLLGGNVLLWKIRHNFLHHIYTNIDGYDEDIETKFIVRLSPCSQLKNIHKYQYIYSFLLYPFMTQSVMLKDFSKIIEYYRSGLIKNPQQFYQEFIIMGVSKAIYLSVALILPCFVTPFSFGTILLAYLYVHGVASFLLCVVFQMAHLVDEAHQFSANPEQGMEEAWAVHQLKTTANFANQSPLFSFWIGAINHQIEHHLFPHICHVHYPAIAPIIQKTAAEFGLPYQAGHSLKEALFSHVSRLKKLGYESLV